MPRTRRGGVRSGDSLLSTAAILRVRTTQARHAVRRLPVVDLDHAYAPLQVIGGWKTPLARGLRERLYRELPTREGLLASHNGKSAAVWSVGFPRRI